MVLLTPAPSSIVSDLPCDPARGVTMSFRSKLYAKRLLQSCGSWRQSLSNTSVATGWEDESNKLFSSTSGSMPQNSSLVGSWKKSLDSVNAVLSRSIRRVGVRAADGADSNPATVSGQRETALEDGEGGETGPCGEIHIILGPMFAGKTTALLQKVQKEMDAGRNVVLAKSDRDARYAVSAIVSHDGVRLPCYAVPDLATFRRKLGEDQYKQLEVIGIDEAQFFPDLLPFCESAADAGKTVLLAGLDGDFLRQPFGKVLHLITLADTVTKLAARCELCGKPAAFSFRKISDTEKVVIGGAEKYMPVCRRHYAGGQAAKEAARSVLSQSCVEDTSKAQPQEQMEPECALSVLT